MLVIPSGATNPWRPKNQASGGYPRSFLRNKQSRNLRRANYFFDLFGLKRGSLSLIPDLL